MTKSSNWMILAAAAFAGGMAVAAGSASATTVCLGGDYGSSSCTASMEQMIFLESATDTTTGFGNVGSQTGLPQTEFTSTDTLDFANGFATITPSAKGGGTSFANLDFTIPGYAFTDLVFDLQMVKADGGQNVTITAYDGSTLEATFALTGISHDADQSYILVATGGFLTSVDITSTSGIKEAKHFEVSGAIPEPSTWAMMLLGFAGLAYAGYRKTKRAALSVA
jgi:hypothetical protein